MEMALQARVADVGKVAAAKEMGLTRQRVQMMCSRNENVWLRIKGGVVVGWYIYRSVAATTGNNDESSKDSGRGNGSELGRVRGAAN